MLPAARRRLSFFCCRTRHTHTRSHSRAPTHKYSYILRTNFGHLTSRDDGTDARTRRRDGRTYHVHTTSARRRRRRHTLAHTHIDFPHKHTTTL